MVPKNVKEIENFCNIFDLVVHVELDDEMVLHQSRSLKSVLVLPPQIFGLFGPPKKRINFDKFNQRQKCVFCVLTALSK